MQSHNHCEVNKTLIRHWWSHYILSTDIKDKYTCKVREIGQRKFAERSLILMALSRLFNWKTVWCNERSIVAIIIVHQQWCRLYNSDFLQELIKTHKAMMFSWSIQCKCLYSMTVDDGYKRDLKKEKKINVWISDSVIWLFINFILMLIYLFGGGVGYDMWVTVELLTNITFPSFQPLKRCTRVIWWKYIKI